MTSKFLYLKINVDKEYEMKKLLTNIPPQIEDIYISVSGANKLKVLEKKELQFLELLK